MIQTGMSMSSTNVIAAASEALSGDKNGMNREDGILCILGTSPDSTYAVMAFRPNATNGGVMLLYPCTSMSQ